MQEKTGLSEISMKNVQKLLHDIETNLRAPEFDFPLQDFELSICRARSFQNYFEGIQYEIDNSGRWPQQ